MTNSAVERKANWIENIKKIILNNLFHESINDDDPFFFNLKYNSNEELIIGDGSNDDPLNLMLTSKFMMSLIESNVISYTGVNNNYRIRLDDTRCFKSCSCNCSKFVKWAICRHVIAYSNFNLLDWYGSKYRQPLKFVNKLKKGAIPKKRLTRNAEKALVHE